MPGDLADHAEEPPDFVLASNLEAGDEFEISNLSTMDADEIPGDYPEFGTFIDCVVDNGDCWVECPRGLAQKLVDAGISGGETFRIAAATKGENDRWEFEIET